MAHYQQLKYVEIVRKHLPAHFSGKKVLEIGSWDANGSVRSFFQNCNYLGVDVAAGPGVDVVAEGQLLDYETGSFDVVIACECFEHNRHWAETFANMTRMLRPGGLLIFSCATLGREEHGTSRMHSGSSLTVQASFSDYYRNLSEQDFTGSFDLDRDFSTWQFNRNIYFKDLYFWGIKRGSDPADMTGVLTGIRDDVQKVTVAGGVSPLKKAKKIVSYQLKYAAARLLGEKAYHDLKFKFRKAFK